jgi:hypothetical protein
VKAGRGSFVAGIRCARSKKKLGWYNPGMTFMTATYELQKPLKAEEFRALGQFANTYGLQNFWVDEKTNHLHFDYDASRLRESVVEHVLRDAKIPVLRRVPA